MIKSKQYYLGFFLLFSILFPGKQFSQNYSYLGQKYYVTAGTQLAMLNPLVNEDFHFNFFPEVSVNKIMSRRISLGITCSHNNFNKNYYYEKPNYTVVSNSIGLNIRFFKLKKKESIAPIGLFCDLNIRNYFSTATHYTYSFLGGTSSSTQSVCMYIQPSIAFGRQGIFYNKLVANTGVFFSPVPPIFLSSPAGFDQGNITGMLWLQSSISVFFSLGYSF